MGGKQLNKLQKGVLVLCSNGRAWNFQDRSKGQKDRSHAVALLKKKWYMKGQMVNILCRNNFQVCVTQKLYCSSADPEGGTGGPDPPWKITSYMGFYRE